MSLLLLPMLIECAPEAVLPPKEIEYSPEAVAPGVNVGFD